MISGFSSSVFRNGYVHFNPWKGGFIGQIIGGCRDVEYPFGTPRVSREVQPASRKGGSVLSHLWCSCFSLYTTFLSLPAQFPVASLVLIRKGPLAPSQLTLSSFLRPHWFRVCFPVHISKRSLIGSAQSCTDNIRRKNLMIVILGLWGNVWTSLHYGLLRDSQPLQGVVETEVHTWLKSSK